MLSGLFPVSLKLRNDHKSFRSLQDRELKTFGVLLHLLKQRSDHLNFYSNSFVKKPHLHQVLRFRQKAPLLRKELYLGGLSLTKELCRGLFDETIILRGVFDETAIPRGAF